MVISAVVIYSLIFAKCRTTLSGLSFGPDNPCNDNINSPIIVFGQINRDGSSISDEFSSERFDEGAYKISFNNSIKFSKPPVVMISFNSTKEVKEGDVNEADNTVTVSLTTNDFTVYTYDIQKGSTIRCQDTRFSFVAIGKKYF